MNLDVLGNGALKISEIGFGCMSLSKAHVDQCEAMISMAVERGINFFDTADLYDKGANEQLIGRLLKPVRHQIVLATKVGNQWRPDGSGWDWNPRAAYIEAAVDKSLQRLQTDYIDLYQLHGGTIEDDIEDTIAAFERLVEQGKIRYYGISSIRPNVIRKYVELSNMQSVMMQYSLLDRRPEEEALNLLQSNKKGVLVRGALAQGLLIDKPAKAYLGYGAGEVAALQERLAEWCPTDAEKIALALDYVLRHDAVSAAVIGFRTPEQLEQVLNAYASKISAGAMEAAAAVLPALAYTDHR
ncbi:aldo/keto reductase [Niabella insulamsoli]|uniref:aldo/keto reductase n=1 Tax=Niabella insulamsoli TaxID=3144874 RepID=UPI0031FD1E80